MQQPTQCWFYFLVLNLYWYALCKNEKKLEPNEALRKLNT